MKLFGKHAHPAAAASDVDDPAHQFEIIIQNIEDGVVLINAQGIIQLFNTGASKITGWPVEEATGISVDQVLTMADEKGEAFPANQSPFGKVFSSGQTVRDGKATLLRRDKKQVALNLVITPLLNQEQAVTAAVAVFRDVSQERAEERQRADFISTASHEMRTPVAAIEGYLALALNDKVSTIDARAREYLEKAHASTQHLGKLFQDLLTSSKAEDGRLTSHPAVVEMGSFLEQLSSDLRFAAEKKGLTVEFVIGSTVTINASKGAADRVVKPLYYVFADPDRLREVITNLFDNAVKYTSDGKISLGLTGDANVVQCYVRDTGPGIPADDIPHLFQKFYRVDNSATRTIGGTGLGLFICRKIVELYNGRIWVESELGKGSSFYINLPRLTPEKAAQLQQQAPNEVRPTTPAAAT